MDIMDEHKRKQRKDEHIKYGMLLEKKLKRNAFDDITILHNCLSEVDMESIDISTKLQSINLENPIIAVSTKSPIKSPFSKAGAILPAASSRKTTCCQS